MLTRTPDDELLAALIAAIGKSDAGADERTRFEDIFRWLRRSYQTRLPAFEADLDHRRLLRKLLANIESGASCAGNSRRSSRRLCVSA